MSKKRSHGTAPLRAAVCFLAIFFIPFVASAQAQSFQLLMSLSDDRSNPLFWMGPPSRATSTSSPGASLVWH